MATFPNGIKTFPTLIDLVDSVLAAHQNERADEITAIETYLLNYSQGSDNWGLNYRIAASVSSNNLVFSILGMDGNPLSTSNPAFFRVANTTHFLTDATTFTKNSGTNFMNLGSTDLIGGNDVDLFVYAIRETGAAAGLKFGYSRISYALTMSDFVNTVTDERYITGDWTNFNAADVVRVIGRFRAQLSTTLNWSIPNPLVINRPIWETDWLTWTPLPGGFSAGNAPAGVYRYRLGKNDCTLFVRQTANGVSNANTFTIPLPISAKSITNMAWGSAGLAFDNTASLSVPAVLRVVSGATVMDVGTTWAPAFTSWNSGGGGKRLSQMNPMLYEI